MTQIVSVRSVNAFSGTPRFPEAGSLGMRMSIRRVSSDFQSSFQTIAKPLGGRLKMLGKDMFKVTKELAGFVRISLGITKPFWKHSTKVGVYSKVSSYLRITAVVTGILGAVSAYQGTKQAFKEKVFEIRAEGALTAIDGIGDVFDSIATFATMLAELGAVTEAAISFATPLVIVGSILNLAGVGVEAAGWYTTNLSLKRVKKLVDDENNPRAAMSYLLSLNEKKLLQRRFGIKIDISPEIQHIVDNWDRDPVGSEQRSRELMEILRGRARLKIGKHLAGTVAKIISLVAVPCLLLVPVPYVGLGLLALATVMRLGIFVHERIQDKRYKKKLQAWRDGDIVKVRLAPTALAAVTPLAA